MNERIKESVNHVINSISDNPNIQVTVDVFKGNVYVYDHSNDDEVQILKWINDPDTGDQQIWFQDDTFEYEAVSYKEYKYPFFRKFRKETKKRSIIDQGYFLERLFNQIKWKYIVR